jgi:hypothetical protein
MAMEWSVPLPRACRPRPRCSARRSTCSTGYRRNVNGDMAKLHDELAPIAVNRGHDVPDDVSVAITTMAASLGDRTVRLNFRPPLHRPSAVG